jgi:ribonucleoside-triphosphate reductase (formate)
MKYVIKRDGRKVEFDKDKIKQAILKAFLAVDGELSDYAEEKANNIAEYVSGLNQEKLEVEEIQDIVERGLMSCKRKDVAKEYILYRDMRTKIRLGNTDLLQRIKEKLDAKNVVNQNANVDEYSFGGRKGEADSEMNRHLALNYVLSDLSRNNHLNNEIYIHDLDSYIIGEHNCLTVPLDDLLANGFTTRQVDIRPAGSVNTAFQLVAVLFQLQSLMQFGRLNAAC